MTPSSGKCVVASALLHGALAALLFLAPAFSARKPPEDQVELRLVDVLPARIIDSAFAGGGGTPKPPPAVAPQSAPLAPPVEKPAPLSRPIEPKAEPKPEPPKPEPPKPEPLKPQPDPEPPPKTHKPEVRRNPIATPKTPAVDLATKDKKETKKPAPEPIPVAPAPHKVEVAKAPVRPSAVELAADRKAREQQTREREEAERRHREFRDQIASAASAVRLGASSLNRRLAGTKIDMPSGPGGEAYINYYSVLYSIYKPRWDRGRPDAVVENLAVVKAAVTIERNGKVLSSWIVQPSGIPAVDKAADRVLKSVNSVPPFPAEMKDTERTFAINFTVEAQTDP